MVSIVQNDNNFGRAKVLELQKDNFVEVPSFKSVVNELLWWPEVYERNIKLRSAVMRKNGNQNSNLTGDRKCRIEHTEY